VRIVDLATDMIVLLDICNQTERYLPVIDLEVEKPGLVPCPRRR
jgi:hypothetical protein